MIMIPVRPEHLLEQMNKNRWGISTHFGLFVPVHPFPKKKIQKKMEMSVLSFHKKNIHSKFLQFFLCLKTKNLTIGGEFIPPVKIAYIYLCVW